jgi:hypothetical protein
MIFFSAQLIQLCVMYGTGTVKRRFPVQGLVTHGKSFFATVFSRQIAQEKQFFIPAGLQK